MSESEIFPPPVASQPSPFEQTMEQCKKFNEMSSAITEKKILVTIHLNDNDDECYGSASEEDMLILARHWHICANQESNQILFILENMESRKRQFVREILQAAPNTVLNVEPFLGDAQLEEKTQSSSGWEKFPPPISLDNLPRQMVTKWKYYKDRASLGPIEINGSLEEVLNRLITNFNRQIVTVVPPTGEGRDYLIIHNGGTPSP